MLCNQIVRVSLNRITFVNPNLILHRFPNFKLEMFQFIKNSSTNATLAYNLGAMLLFLKDILKSNI